MKTLGLILPAAALAAFFGAGYWMAGRTSDVEVRLAALEDVAGIKRAPVDVPGTIALKNEHSLGSAAAPIALVVYTDFECPFCAAFNRDEFPTIRKQYVDSGKLRFSVKLMPVIETHPFAETAATAAECAGRQGKFFEMHDALFLNDGPLGDDAVRTVASQVGLNGSMLAACMADGTRPFQVIEDSNEGRRFEFSGTPSFVIGPVDSKGMMTVSEHWSGNRRASDIAGMIDELLAAKR